MNDKQLFVETKDGNLLHIIEYKFDLWDGRSMIEDYWFDLDDFITVALIKNSGISLFDGTTWITPNEIRRIWTETL